MKLFRFGKNFAVKIVEAPDDLASQLDVRSLVLANRHEVGLVHDDVGSLQDRLPEKSVVTDVFFADVLALLFVSRHALEPTERRHCRQDQVKLGVLGYHRLNEDGRTLCIESRYQPVAHHVDRVLFNTTGVGVIAGERVQVGNEVKTIIVAGDLQANPLLELAFVVAEMKIPGRAHSAYDSFLARLASQSTVLGVRSHLQKDEDEVINWKKNRAEHSQEHQQVEQHKTVWLYLIISFGHRVRQQFFEHVASIERRHRYQIEYTESDVQQQHNAEHYRKRRHKTSLLESRHNQRVIAAIEVHNAANDQRFDYNECDDGQNEIAERTSR